MRPNRPDGLAFGSWPWVSFFTSTSIRIGTSVRERTYDASIPNTTASACGVNRNFGASVRNVTDTNAQQIESVEISAGFAIPAAPSTTALRNSCPSSSSRYVFSIATVASSTRMPTASARPPSVMMLTVSPSAASTAIDVRMDSGIETSTIRVERHDPKNSRIISPVRPAAIAPSRITSSIAPDTNTD